MPPMAKASHIALPAACATTPRIEKIPAPTIPPMPIETAADMPISPDPALAADALFEDLGSFEVMLGTHCHRMSVLDLVSWKIIIPGNAVWTDDTSTESAR